MSLKQNNLLELKESYLYVDWLHPNTDYQMIAIFRDVEKDGTWVLEQFRGPWSKMISGYLVTALSKTDGTKELREGRLDAIHFRALPARGGTDDICTARHLLH